MLQGTDKVNHICFVNLRRNIIDSVYAPGEKLTIARLKRDLNFGQSPIREALSRLLAKGLLQLEKNKGFRVAGISEKELRDLVTTIALIIPIAIKESLKSGNDQWEINLVASFHELSLIETKKESVNYLSFVESNFAFNKTVMLGSNSKSLIYIYDILSLKIERYLKLAIKLHPPLAEKCHSRKRGLFEAALKRDVEETCRIFTRLLIDSSEDIVKILKDKKFF